MEHVAAQLVICRIDAAVGIERRQSTPPGLVTSEFIGRRIRTTGSDGRLDPGIVANEHLHENLDRIRHGDRTVIVCIDRVKALSA